MNSFNNTYKFIAALFIVLVTLPLSGQRLNGDSEVEITLNDGTNVCLMRAFQIEGEGHLWYYLPVNLRISLKENNTPEYSFLTYKEEEEGEIKGALMHWLLTWGLTSIQEIELQHELNAMIDTMGVVVGAVQLEQDDEEPGMKIVSDSCCIAEILQNSLKSSGGVPLFPGGKIAASFFFNAMNAKTMDEALKDGEKLENIYIVLQYELPEIYYTSEKRWTKRKYMLQGNLRNWIDKLQSE